MAETRTRTWITLDESVAAEAKGRAAQDGRTFSAFVEAALREALEETRVEAFAPGHLAPYVSIIPLEVSEELDPTPELRERLTQLVRERIEAAETPGNRLRRIGPVTEKKQWRGWYVLGWWYGLERTPQWIARSDDVEETAPIVLSDLTHHLALLLLGREHNARFLVAAGTRAALQRQVVRRLVSKYPTPSGDPLFSPIPADDMAEAFVRGNAHQVALYGLHRPINSKADTKALTGPDLRQAIDPFGDQSYRLDAALSDIESARILADFRGRLPEGSRLRELSPDDAIGSASGRERRRLVGMSFKDGRIWTQATRTMGQFLREVENLCHLIAQARKSPQLSGYGFNQRGFDALTRETVVTSTELGSPLDLELRLPLPGDADEGKLGRDAILASQKWLSRGEFRLERTDGSRLFVEALFDGRPIATLRIQPVLGLGRGVDYSITVETEERYGAHDTLDILDQVLAQFSERAVVWFDNGYALQAGRAYRPRYRDVPFDGWRWLDLAPGGRAYRADLEKPMETGTVPTAGNPEKSVTRQKKLWKHEWDGESLFDFVVHQAEQLFECEGKDWHLLSDDRSGELADFVYVEPSRRRMALLHVKAAGSAVSPSIAPAKYEVVVSQATKNLRFLDREILIEQLRAAQGTPIERVTWENGRLVPDRRRFLEALETIGSFPKKEVIVFQPHTTRQVWERAESDLREDKLSEGERIQLLRLKTLLADLESVCRRREASLTVWGREFASD